MNTEDDEFDRIEREAKMKQESPKNMTKDEAMKLALEALEGLEALLLSMGLTHLIVYGDAEKAITSLSQAIANEALDRMAENARELGLDYEPAQQEPVKHALQCICGCSWEIDADGNEELVSSAPAQQEPVAWLHTKIEGVAVPHRPADLDRHPDRWTPLYKDPAPCPTCEALARTVMLDQTSHDTSPPASKPLTDEQIKGIYEDCDAPTGGEFTIAFTRAIEAAHGITKE